MQRCVASTRFSLTIAIFLALAACGGGGGGSSPSAATASSTGTGNTATGSTGSGSTSSGATGSGTGTGGMTVTTAPPNESLASMSGANVVPVLVNQGPEGNVPNLPLVSVTLCAPSDPSNCAVVTNLQVDTGSTGLRVVASVLDGLNPNLRAALPVVTQGGSSVAECAVFADGVSWGTVRSASVTMGSETTTAPISVQVVDDLTAGHIAPACAHAGSAEETVAQLGANGIIGIGYFLQDCGTECALQVPTTPIYYICPAGVSCSGATLATSSQVSNPIASLPALFNNGNVIMMPSVPSSGAATASGYLVLGVNTASNNMLGSAQPIDVDDEGNLTVTYKGSNYASSFVDSGSSIYFFNDASVARCPSGATAVAAGFYCPSADLNASATLVSHGVDTDSFAFSFEVINAITLFNQSPNGFAFDDLAGPEDSAVLSSTDTFDVGFPFFYGRSVFTVFEGRMVNVSLGPFAAVSAL